MDELFKKMYDVLQSRETERFVLEKFVIDENNFYGRELWESEMKPLKNKFRKYLVSPKKNPNRYMKCWAEDASRKGYQMW